MARRRILVVAGEASSDSHGAGLIARLKARGEEAEFYGIGGNAMAAEGVQLIAHSDELSVVGLFEALSILPRAISLLRRIRTSIKEDPPDLFIPIDSPDFNLRLVGNAHKQGVPVLYFVAPQVWAWRSGRVNLLKKFVAELLVLFPFEKAWFTSRGVETTYIGHPKLDAALSFSSSAVPATESHSPRILFLPGSRRGEVSRHLPILAGAVGVLKSTHPAARFVLRMSDSLPESFYQSLIGSELIELSRSPMTDLCHESDLAVSVSGTASFEVALSGTPCIVVYKMNFLSWLIARQIVQIKHVSMANIAAGKVIVPELLQADCNPMRIAAELSNLIADDQKLITMRQELLALRDLFGEPGAYDRAASRVISILNRSSC